MQDSGGSEEYGGEGVRGMTPYRLEIKWGSVSIVPDPVSPLHSYKVTIDEKGETTRERFYSHFGCIGQHNCYICGAKL